jgi:pSer/pThr/pTyr-binding forkhead associated (FHA) protein
MSRPLSVSELLDRAAHGRREWDLSCPCLLRLASGIAAVTQNGLYVSPKAQVWLVRPRKTTSAWQPVIVGRDKDCDIVLANHRVSRRHASFERDPSSGRYLLVDRCSRNGTRVNRDRLPPLTPRALNSGDTLVFANIETFFVSAERVLAAAESAQRSEKENVP